MNKAILVIGALLSAGLAYGSAGTDFRTSTPTRLKGGRRRVPAVTVSMEDLAAATADVGLGVSGPAAGGASAADPKSGGAGASVPGPTPESTPKAPPKPLELHDVEDVDLSVVLNGQEPTFRRSCEIHLDIEGGLTWHAGGKAAEIKSYGALGRGFDQKFDVDDVVIVADKLTNWQDVRWAAKYAQKKGREKIWIGVASYEEPKKLRVLSMLHPADVKAKPPTGDVFKVYVREKKNKPYIEVNGKLIEAMPSDLAIAWNAWKKGKDVYTEDAADTPVILDAHKFTPVEFVCGVIDVLRGLGIKTEFYVGDIGRPRR